jgi:molybdopterin synthase catalytic subunit
MIAIVDHVIDVEAARAAVTDTSRGAVIVFCGVTRDTFDGRGVVELEYETYTDMALGVLRQIADEIVERWPETKVSMVHRVGVVPNGEVSVVIATATPHRPECYEANRYGIEELKRRVPIWKKEIYADGSAWKANASTGPG